MDFEIASFRFRSVGKTQMNEQSSRSHFVFTLRISGVNEVRIILSFLGVCIYGPKYPCCLADDELLVDFFRPWSNMYKGFSTLLILRVVNVFPRVDPLGIV